MKFSSTLVKGMATLAVLALVACNSEAPPTASLDNPQPSPEASNPAPNSAPPNPETSAGTQMALDPGQYCYAATTDTLDGVVRLTVTEDNQVMGDSLATISDETNGYFTSYRQTMEGSLNGTELLLEVKTEIEADLQTATETWTVEGDRLNDSRTTFDLVDCATVSDRFADTSNTQTEDPLSAANTVHAQEVRFDPGTSSTIVSNAVVRGDRDVYLLNARQGQVMLLSITALENNAAFDVLSPDGNLLVREDTETEVQLPQTGDYKVVVGGIRGNASYSLFMGIR